ncbi:MAG: ATP-binding protein [Victivallales bacterium]|nr:ATP-binding protein [Victivallales bacterium]
MTKKITISGVPEHLPEDEAAVLRSRLLSAYEDMDTALPGINPVISVGPKGHSKHKKQNVDKGESEKSNQYTPVAPLYSFEQLVLPPKIMSEITNAIQILNIEALVFDTWGLREIEPNPKTALNFYGPPGTGKTLSAHAIAHYLKKKIFIASYAEIESKYHGDGPKNVKALFAAAEKEEAVLFIDEADSLLSKRLTNVTQGSEQAINSMRSQLLINLELFHGVVIFSTNLVENYDKAFETRIRHVEFTMPDEKARGMIWKKHLPELLPVTSEVCPFDLASRVDDVCGRDIKNAVINAAVEAALNKKTVSQKSLLKAIHNIKDTRIKSKTKSPKGKKLTKQERADLSIKVKESLKGNNDKTDIEIIKQ